MVLGKHSGLWISVILLCPFPQPSIVAWNSLVLSASGYFKMWMVVFREPSQLGHTSWYLVEYIFDRCALIPRVPVTCFVIKSRTFWEIFFSLLHLFISSRLGRNATYWRSFYYEIMCVPYCIPTKYFLPVPYLLVAHQMFALTSDSSEYPCSSVVGGNRF